MTASSTDGGYNAGLRYDPLGRLLEVTGGLGTQLLYDGDELVAEYDPHGALLRRYVHGAAVDDPTAWYEGAGLGQRRSLHTDHQGSIVAVADSTANIIKINGYDAWGVPNAGANANLGRFQYTGQIWLPEIGMYHYKARLYSPTLGRFLQTDPIGYKDQVNLYAYVGNDPLNGSDPDGQQSVSGALTWIQESAETVRKDLVDLGTALYEGDLEYALGGMPPTMGGGVVRTAATGVGAVSATATRGAVVANEAHVARDAARQLYNARSVVARQTKEGGRGLKVTDPDGLVRDIKPGRVKEARVNPRAGTEPVWQKVARPIAGTKGRKRLPTPAESRMLQMRSPPGVVCRWTGFWC